MLALGLNSRSMQTVLDAPYAVKSIAGRAGFWISNDGSTPQFLYPNTLPDYAIPPRGQSDNYPIGLSMSRAFSAQMSAELLTNGTFAGNATGWQLTNAVYSGGLVNINATGDGVPGIVAQAAVSLTVGKFYRIAYRQSSLGQSGPWVSQLYPLYPSTNDVAAIARAESGGGFAMSGTDYSNSVDNVSLKEIQGEFPLFWQNSQTAGVRPVRSHKKNLFEQNTEAGCSSAVTGSSPPTANVNDTYLGVPCCSVTFAAGISFRAQSSSQFNTLTVPANPSGNLQISISGMIALSRPLTGSESMRMFAEGAWGIPPGLVLTQANSPTGWQLMSGTSTFPTTVGGQTDALWVENAIGSSALSAPLTIYFTKMQAEVGAPSRYQRVTALSDYDANGFPGYAIHGPATFMLCDFYGGSTTSMFFCSSVMIGKVGATQVLFSDAGLNTGFEIGINASNQLYASAGTGAARVVATAPTVMAFGDKVVLTVTHDGTTLSAQVNNNTTGTAALATATAGTTGITMGRTNGAATNYFEGRIYEYAYTKNHKPPAITVGRIKTFVGAQANIVV